jgi:CBS domain-containing protein
MKTSEICRKQVVVSKRSTPLDEVARLMRKGHVGCVVVLEEGDGKLPVGIVTDRDLVIEVMAPGLDARDLTAGDVMTTSPAVTRETDDVLWALKTMRDRGIRRLPVVDEAGTLKGIVAMDDVMENVGVALGDIVQALGTERSVENWRRAS